MAILIKAIQQIFLGAIIVAAYSVSWAQESQDISRTGWTLKPSLNLKEILTDNVRLTAANRQSEQISEISPSLLVDVNSPFVRTYISYQMRALAYAENSRPDTVQHSLNSFGKLALVKDWLFLDLIGEVAQQTVSAFGSQVGNDAIFNPNRTETARFSASPYVEGQLLGMAEYKLKYTSSSTQSRANQVDDLASTEKSGELHGFIQGSLGWNLSASKRQDQFGNGEVLNLDRTRGAVNVAIDSEAQVSIFSGRDANNYSSRDRNNFATYGVELKWVPGPRTTLSFARERKFFGTATNLNLSHRVQHAVIQYADNKDASVLPNQFSTFGRGNIYDLLFDQFSSMEPDPGLRGQLVMNYLNARNIPASALVIAGFLSSRVVLQRQRSLSVALNGARTTLTLLSQISDSSALTASTGSAVDDFASAETIRQRGETVLLTHRLSPFVNGSIAYLSQKNTGEGLVPQMAKFRSVDIGIAAILSSRLTANLTLRRNTFGGKTTSYRERVATGALSISF